MVLHQENSQPGDDTEWAPKMVDAWNAAGVSSHPSKAVDYAKDIEVQGAVVSHVNPSMRLSALKALFGLLLVSAQPGGVLNGSLASTVMLTASDPPYVPSAGTFIAGSMMHECATTHGYSTTTIVS